MTTLLRLRQTVADDHHLHLVLPPDFPPGEVEVTVRSTATPSEPVADQQGADLARLFHMLAALPVAPRSNADIERQIQEERDAWE